MLKSIEAPILNQIHMFSNKVLMWGALSGGVLTLAACSMPEEIKQNELITQQVVEAPDLIQSNYQRIEASYAPYQIHYVSSTKRNEKPEATVVFVHGTPGSWGAFSRYFTQPDLASSYRLVAIDRPGWGESSYPLGDFPTRLETQSALIGPVLEAIWRDSDERPVILVGHSLGGSLVPILAADYPRYVQGIVILAGDIDPDLAGARWYNTLLDWIPEAVIPDEWYNSNREVLDLTPSLALAQDKLAELTLPITIIQGSDDSLVDPNNVELASQLFRNSALEVEMIQGAGHLINLQYVDRVKAAIERVVRDSRIGQ